MGPRLSGRGKARRARSEAVARADRFNGAATIRSRKGSNSRGRRACCWWLQWGRDYQVAESARSSLSAAAELSALQWGRDYQVAESSRRQFFTAVGPSLQWGRDYQVAERRDERESRAANRFASMGPRLSGRGKRGRS